MKNRIETLKKNYEFKRVLNKGKYCSGKYIDIYITKNKLRQNLLGFVVGTKVAKAVKRNRIRRLIRESYRLMEPELKKGYSIIIMWKKKQHIENATFFNINKDLVKIFKEQEIFDYKEI